MLSKEQIRSFGGTYDFCNELRKICNQALLAIDLKSDIDQMRIAKIVDNLHEMEAIKDRAELQAELESVNTANRELHSANESKKAKLDAVREYCVAETYVNNGYDESGMTYIQQHILAILDGDT